MKQNTFLKRIICILVISVLLAESMMYIKSEASTVKEAEQEKQNTEQQKKEAQAQQNQLNSEMQGLEDYLNGLNSDLADISNNLDVIESQLSDKQEEIATTQVELEKAKSDEHEQYESMKLRIKYMYEKGSDSYLEVILSSGSFVELVNRIEYVSQMSEYDRNMLLQYQETKDKITAKTQELSTAESELQNLHSQAEKEQENAKNLIASTSGKIALYSSQINDAQSAISKYEEQLKSQEAEIERLQAAKDAAAAKEAAKKNNSTSSSPTNSTSGSTSSGTGNYSQAAEGASNLELLSAIIECEAGGEGYEEMLGVGSVVMNRVRSSKYPNTILGVLYQRGQFSPVASGRFAIVLARGASSICIQAANKTMGGYSNVGDCLGFRLASTGIQGTVIGDMVFF